MIKLEGGSGAKNFIEKKKESDPVVSAEEIRLDSFVRRAKDFWNHISGFQSSESEIHPGILENPREPWLVNWRVAMMGSIDKLDPDTQEILYKLSTGKLNLKPKEYSKLGRARDKFWRKNFGVSFSSRKRFSGEKLKKEKSDINFKRIIQDIKEFIYGHIKNEGALKHERVVSEIDKEADMEMARMRKGLQSIDKGEDLPSEELKKRRIVFYNHEDKSFFVRQENGADKNMTFGDILGDFSWGIMYAPDVSMPHNLWRKIRKVLVIYEAREHLENIYDKKINHNLSVGLHPIRKSPKILEGLTDKKLADMNGWLAEQAIVGFLTRIEYNNPHLGMRTERSNILEDVILKYDFKLETKKRIGVALESEDVSREKFVSQKRRLGIQLTISSNVSYLSKKLDVISTGKRRISQYENLVRKKVDDIVLLRIPQLKIFVNLYKFWIKDGKPSGGPEQYLTREQKMEIFKQATKGLLDLSDEELNNLKI